MNQDLKNKCELFISNRDMMKQCFKWEGDAWYLLCSILFVCENKNISIEKMKICEKILKEKTGIFSEFRGNIKMPLITKMEKRNAEA